MSETAQEHAKSDPKSAAPAERADPGRLAALVKEALSAKDPSKYDHVWDMVAEEHARKVDEERRKGGIKRWDPETERALERERALARERARDRVMEHMQESMSKRSKERMDKALKRDAERRLEWYSKVGVHGDFARDCARYMASMSC